MASQPASPIPPSVVASQLAQNGFPPSVLSTLAEPTRRVPVAPPGTPEIRSAASAPPLLPAAPEKLRTPPGAMGYWTKSPSL